MSECENHRLNYFLRIKCWKDLSLKSERSIESTAYFSELSLDSIESESLVAGMVLEAVFNVGLQNRTSSEYQDLTTSLIDAVRL